MVSRWLGGGKEFSQENSSFDDMHNVIYYMYMGKVLKNTSGKFAVYILSDDHEPKHVHFYAPRKHRYECMVRIKIEDQEIYLENEGFSGKEIKVFQKLVRDNKEMLLEKWEEIQSEQE